MRKFLVTGFGVLLVSGAFVFTSDAQVTSCGCFTQDSVSQKSRYKSKGCCADAKRATRPFSDRIGPWQYRKTRTKCKNCQIYRNPHASGRADVYLYSQYQKSNLSHAQKLAYQRQLFGWSNGGRSLNTVASDRIVVRNNDFVYKTGVEPANTVAYVEPQNFALAIPRSFAKQNGVYRSQGSSMAFRIVSGGKCNAIAFLDCAKRLETKFQKENNLSLVYGEKTVSRWQQTVLSDFGYFQTVTKSYSANARGQRNTYFTFTALDPVSGEIVRIEGVANAREESSAVQHAYNLFESFRFRI